MSDTKAVGDVSEAVILAELLKLKKSVLVPFGERHRYDLVIDEGGRFLRVQCKTGRVLGDALKFNTYSVVRDSKTKKYVKRYYSEKDIDFYGVYCPENKKSYLIPVGKVSRGEGSLCVTPGGRSEKRGLLAASFEISEAAAGMVLALGC